MNKQPKQVIVLRKDLNMRKGKMVAQGSHASMGVVFQKSLTIEIDGKKYKAVEYGEDVENWFNNSFIKICVGCESEQELLELHKKAEELGIKNCLIQDSGFTEFHGVPTYTALGLGPDKAELIDLISGHLKLL